MRIQPLKMDLFSDIAGAASAAMPTAAISTALGFGQGYMNMRNQNERLDRQEANSWDMYQQQRSDQNTAHQREAEDLKKAGYNPLLTGMTGQGLGSATGSASGGSTTPMQMPDMLGGIATLTQLAQKDRELDQKDYSNKTDRLGTIADVNYKTTQSKNEKYGIQGMISDFFRGLKNENHDYLNMNDIMNIFKKSQKRPGIQPGEMGP